jgi:hypothetical protein
MKKLNTKEKLVIAASVVISVVYLIVKGAELIYFW